MTPGLSALPPYKIKNHILLLTYKAWIGDAPSYLKELVVPYGATRELRSLNAGLLVVPRVFSYHAPLLRNQLPPSVLEAATVTSFKSRLKTFLFNSLIVRADSSSLVPAPRCL